MHTVAIRAVAAEDWLPLETAASGLRAIEAKLLERAVILNTQEEIRTAVSEIRRLASGAEYVQFAETLTRLPRARRGSTRAPDLVVHTPPGGECKPREITIDQVVYADEFIPTDAETRLAVGTARDTIFSRWFATFAETAEGCVIFDSYALDQDSAYPKPGLVYLLRKLDTAGLERVEIICESRTLKADYAHEVVTREVANLRLRVHIKVASKIDHDRHIRLRFGTSIRSRAISLGHGVDVFASEKTTEVHTVEFTDHKNAREREERWRESVRKSESTGGR
jgi:hypothetical protein